MDEFLGVVAGEHLDATNRSEGLIEWLEPDGALAIKCGEGGVPSFDGFFPELYKAWLLLTEVLDFGSFVGKDREFHFKVGHEPSHGAIAARHWYKTACIQQAEDLKADREIPIPIPLPGHFTTRGDWNLAVAAGSSSERLADLALDVLSSRRANFARLQAGLGLPVRDVLAGDASAGIRTPIMLSREKTATYGDVVNLGGRYSRNDSRGESDRRRSDLHWLWRCSLADYDRQSRVFGSWLNRLFEWTQSYRADPTVKWLDGFESYDNWGATSWKKPHERKRIEEFAKLCDVLLAGLRQASRA